MHIITRFDKGGSAENTFLTVCGLDTTRYDVSLITGASLQGNLGEKEKESGDSENEAVRANITAVREQGVRLIGLPHLIRELRPFSELSAFFSLIRIIRREKPRIVHTHTSKAGILGRWAAFICRVPVIIHTPHGHVFWGYFRPWQTRLFILLERWTARITDRIVALTPQERSDHLRFRIAPKEKFTVIHSGVDLTRFYNTVTDISQMKKNLNLPGGSFVVGTLGRLTPVKGQIHLLRAAVEIVADRPDIYFVFVGEGELHDDLEKFAEVAGIMENVRFPGWKSDVASVLSVFDIFVFPSLNEGMGKAIVEAMVMGKPIIASDIGGISDLVVSGETGILVPPAGSNAIAEAIKTLYANPEKRTEMGKRGQERAAAYSAESMLHKIKTLYECLL